MLKPARIPLTIYQGVDFYEPFRAGDAAAGTYTDTAGYTATCRVYPGGDYTAAPVVELTSENGGIWLGIDGVTLAETTLAGSAAKGASSVTIASATGVSSGDRIDIVLDDGNVVPTTIATLAGTTVTLATALPAAAASGNAVYVHENAPGRFGLYNVLLYIGKAATGELTPWGEGGYVLDLVDPYGHEQRLAQHTCVLQEGD